MKSRIKSVIWTQSSKKQQIRTARRKKNPKNEDSVRRLWDYFNSTNIHIIGDPEGEEKE